MNITPIASSSSGNCFIVESGGFQLILDCGVPLSRIREALNHDLSKVLGCLVTHEHGDHAGFLSQLKKETPIPIYCTEGTKKRFSLKSVQCITGTGMIDMGPHISFGAVEFNHDVECYGFLIYSNRKKLLYATDTGDIRYTIKGLTHLMIEANHSFQALIDSDLNKAAVKRICETHLSISQVCEFVERHPDLEEIHLIHLSDGHSDAKEFKRMVQDVSGVPVFIAGK